jgi:hypothetical protein
MDLYCETAVALDDGSYAIPQGSGDFHICQPIEGTSEWADVFLSASDRAKLNRLSVEDG